MDLNRTPAKIADAAAEEIRALNHRTLDPGAYEQPPEVSGAVSALMTLVQRLPQAVRQAQSGLMTLDDQNMIRLDYGDGSRTELVNAVSTAVFGLTEACGLLERAAQELKAAAGPLSHMGGPWPADGEDDEA